MKTFRISVIVAAAAISLGATSARADSSNFFDGVKSAVNSPFDWAIRKLDAVGERRDKEWEAKAPAVDDSHGIGWERGAIFGVTYSTDFTKRGGFTALEAPAGELSIKIDIDRLMKLSPDSDRYAYWLATSQPFDVLVEAFRDAPAGADVDKEGLNTLDSISRGARSAEMACGEEMRNRENRDRGYVYQTFPCERYELRLRKSLMKEDPLLALTTLSQALSGTDQRLNAIGVTFTNGKKRIGVAYAVLAQARYTAQFGRLSNNIGRIANLRNVNPALGLRLANTAVINSGRQPIAHFSWTSEGPQALTVSESAAVFGAVVPNGKQKLAEEVQQALRDARIDL
nr:hypothetical protein [uncultured Roseateles sp.]